jgi:predicted acyl esterase
MSKNCHSERRNGRSRVRVGSESVRLPGLLLAWALGGLAWPINDTSEMVPMSDGVRLATRIIRPDGTGPFPVLLERTPYPHQRTLGPDSNLPVPGSNQRVRIRTLLDKDYSIVIQNTRGREGSEGAVDWPSFPDGWGTPSDHPHMHADGVDTIGWLRAQTWCNGRIATWGASAGGISQNMLSGANPPGIACQWITNGTANLYADTPYLGGALRKAQLDYLSAYGFDPDILDVFLAHPAYDNFWTFFDVTTRQSFRNYPVVIRAAWYDTFQKTSLDNFISLRRDGGAVAREESKLIISLATHGGGSAERPPHGLWWPAEAEASPPGYNLEDLFDRWVMEVDNGFDELPRVAYYLMGDLERPGAPGNEWRTAAEWPVPAVQGRLFCHHDGTLRPSAQPGDGLPRAFDYDPTDPVPTLGGNNLMIDKGPWDQRPVEGRSDVLLFETSPLDSPVEVTGAIQARVWASSDRLDTDFTAKLTDVYPDGKSLLIADGIIRTRYRDSFEMPELMEPGTVHEFEIDLWSFAIVFDEGHRIRLALSSSNAPRFAPNPNTGAPISLEDPVNPLIARNTIYLDRSRPTHLILPIVNAADDDEDGRFDIIDAFPSRSDETDDSDGDGMGDNFEQRIIDDDAVDDCVGFEDVAPEDDYDGDGDTNIEEFSNGTDPTRDENAGVRATWLAYR